MDNNKRRYGGGWSFFFVVLTFGIILALFGVSVGIGVSARIPLTNANISAGGALGKKEVAAQALPGYLNSRIASNNDFFNHSSTMTIWLAEGLGMLVLGNQPDAPVIDLNLNLIR